MQSTKIIAIGIVVASVLGLGIAVYLHNAKPEPPSLTKAPEPVAVTPAARPILPPTPPTTPTGLQLYGVVIDGASGVPVEGATVRLRRGGQRNENGPKPLEAKSDAKGTYTLDVDSADYRVITCEAKGYTRSRQPFPANASGRVRLDFPMQPGATIAGTVTDKTTGAPVKDVRVEALNTQQSMLQLLGGPGGGGGGNQGRRAQTTDDGTYQIEGLEPGTFRIVLSARGAGYIFASNDAKLLDVAEGQEYDGVDFQIDRGGVIQGTVKNDQGQVLPNAHVWIMPAQMVQVAMQGLNASNPDAFADLNAHTDDKGHYEVTGMNFDLAYNAHAHADTYATSDAVSFTIAKNKSPMQVDITVQKGWSISGIAKYETGDIAKNEGVVLFPVDRARWTDFEGPQDTKTSDKGEFSFKDIKPGDYLVRGRGGRGPMQANSRGDATPVTLNGKADVTGVQVTIAKKKEDEEEGKGVIQGTVVASDGKPLAEIHVDARRNDRLRETAGATTETDGTFEIKALKGNSYDLSVMDDRGMAESKNVRVGSNVTLQVQPPGKISGVVVMSNGEPASTANVSLVAANEKSAPDDPRVMESAFQTIFAGGGRGTPTDAYGQFEFTKVKPGTYTVKAQSSGKGTAVSNTLTVGPGSEIPNVRLELDAGVTFSGTVVGPNSEPVAGALIQLVPVVNNMMVDMVTGIAPAGLMKPAGSTMSGPNGEFTVTLVPPGSYKVIGAHNEYAKSSQEVQIASHQDVTNFRLVMSKPGTARGVYMANGAPQPGVMVMFFGPNGFQVAQTDAQGQYDVSGLSSGSYLVSAFDPAQMTQGNGQPPFAQQVLDVAGGGTTNLDLGGNPAGGQALTGNITGAGSGTTFVTLNKPGAPTPDGVNISNLSEIIDAIRNRQGTPAIVNSDGSFQMDGVPPGTYTLNVYTTDTPVNGGNPGPLGIMAMTHPPVYQQEITIAPNQPPVLNINLAQPAKT